MESDLLQFPVSEKVTTDLRTNPDLKGDTTGCGDNFAGGIIASIAMQLRKNRHEKYNLEEAVSWGVASGGFSCYTLGGTYLEKSSGEKLKLVRQLQQEYLTQIRK
jgi:hypothetical protein